MLRHLKEDRAATAIERAVEAALLNANTHTLDLSGQATTQHLTQAIVERMPHFLA